ncbi:MAG TPA: BON domain-containing protein [Burkholderiales bacterium]|nr:BON domain-containing protein [Burkholderiales bacterium]
MKTMPILLSLLISLPVFAETDRISMEQAKEKAKQTGADAKRATKNAALTGRVKSALAADVGLKTVKIDVDSAEGVVTLKGHVDSEDTKLRAAATAKKVSGVTQVRNQLDAKN